MTVLLVTSKKITLAENTSETFLQPLREMDTLPGETTLSKLLYLPSENLLEYTLFTLFFRRTPFPKELDVQESKQEVI